MPVFGFFGGNLLRTEARGSGSRLAGSQNNLPRFVKDPAVGLLSAIKVSVVLLYKAQCSKPLCSILILPSWSKYGYRSGKMPGQ